MLQLLISTLFTLILFPNHSFTASRTTREQKSGKYHLLGLFSYNHLHQVPQHQLTHAKATYLHLCIIKSGKEMNSNVEITGQALDFKRMLCLWQAGFHLTPSIFTLKQNCFCCQTKDPESQGLCWNSLALVCQTGKSVQVPSEHWINQMNCNHLCLSNLKECYM